MNDFEFLESENNKKPVIPPPNLISEYIDGFRIMPPGTPFPGPVDINKTAYVIEIMDCMAPSSPIREVDVMKGAQTGLTWTAENICAYWMDANPTEILYCSATDALLDKWARKRLEPLIDSIGMRNKISAQTENTKTRRTGDKTFSKEYVGGALDMASLQSAGSLRSDSKRVVLVDEVDGAPVQLRTGEGNFLDVLYARTNAWGERKKIFRYSTPTTFEASLIYQEYLLGDQRKYFIKCPHCGFEQILEFDRLKPVYEDKLLISAYYDCLNDKCNTPIYNYHKTGILEGGRWKPTGVSTSKYRRSYHISSLYSPVGMLSWSELYQIYLNAQITPDGMRSFTNLYLGEPFKETGARPDREKVIELRGTYRSGEIQDGVLYLTTGIDVQRGSETNPDNPPRLEMEVLGIGFGYRTWGVEYKVFYGAINDPYSGAWEKLNQWAQDGGLQYKRSDGRVFSPAIIFVDSGDGPHIDTVYGFCARWVNTFPSKGFSILKKRSKEKKVDPGDEIGIHNFKRYRAAKTARAADVLFYEISTNYYKTHIYNNLKIQRRPEEPQRPGFCNFPIDYSEKYFDMLTAEEKHTDGSFHSHGRRNEALDCRVMAICAGDVFLDAKVMDAKAAAKVNGASATDLLNVNHRLILDIMVRNTSRRKPVS
jgi:phage terminase large subunit GpA-like protein